MSNTITIELCAEDRARLDKLSDRVDRLADLLESRIVQAEEIVATASRPDPVREALIKALEEDAEQLTIDDIPKEAPTTPQDRAGEAEAETLTTTPQNEEEPVAEESAPKAEPVEPAVTLEQIQQKVVQLAAADNGAKKAAVREIINAHAKKVSDLPEDKWAEVWSRLTELEVR